MNTTKFTFKTLVLTLCLACFFSCGDDKKKETTEQPVKTEKKEEVSQPKTIEITLNSDDNMKFDLSTINVYEGQTVTLKLVHTGEMSKDVMGHNFVLLTQGTSVSEFGNSVVELKDNDYIPEDTSNIIAHTKLIGGGESDTITFEAPAKGIYDFLCSFPGHYAIMKGKFIVRENK
ncbi:azurin [Winogradskyella epiphytica]|uniref:Azurin n=1 Tax=Winogradskyella epiphytica TaxID=262005 RepID=A0A2V4YFZ3_9FLAO|nr:azurin [Winogradskyella epiphytica]PYE82843.1 azurin [Winogradskyella epiphytica]GGW54058.1 hypothetical protein GCM10008085_01450 [Winogradskyella epiphytica]